MATEVRKWVAAATTVAIAGGLFGAPATAAVSASEPDCWTGPGLTADGAVLDAPGEVSQRLTDACTTAVRSGRALTVSADYRSPGWVRAVVYAYSPAAGWRAWFTGAPFPPVADRTPLSATTPATPPGTTRVAVGFVGDASTLSVWPAPVVDATRILTASRFAVFKPTLPRRSGLVTNSYAYRVRKKAKAARSADWEVTAGSLFSRNGNGYTGRPDDGLPGARSAVHTGSAVYRMNTKRKNFGNVAVSFELYASRVTSTGYTPPSSYDGVHIWLRHTSQYQLYAASVARRDGTLMIKKKCPGGPSNGGTYYTLGEVPGRPTVFRRWIPVAASAQNNLDGSVTLVMSVAGRAVLSVVDDGIGCAPIRAASPIGIRGDNTEFQFRKVVAKNLWNG
jgi:hypothetical protein